MGGKKTCRFRYRSGRDGTEKILSVPCDRLGYPPMYIERDGCAWKAVSPFSLNVVDSEEFFASAHEFRIKTEMPPLDGSDFGYHLT